MAKAAYIGIPTAFPVYKEETKTIAITAANVAQYFTVTNGSYYFAGSGNVFTSNNGGVNSSEATTTLTAKVDISSLSFRYSYSSEQNYDKFTLTVGGTTVESAVSGATTTKSYSGSLKAGQSIVLTYAKDSSQHKNDDKCTISNISITTKVKTQTGTETKPVARKVKSQDLGAGGVARKVSKGFVGVNGVARQFFAATPTWKKYNANVAYTLGCDTTTYDDILKQVPNKSYVCLERYPDGGWCTFASVAAKASTVGIYPNVESAISIDQSTGKIKYSNPWGMGYRHVTPNSGSSTGIFLTETNFDPYYEGVAWCMLFHSVLTRPGDGHSQSAFQLSARYMKDESTEKSLYIWMSYANQAADTWTSDFYVTIMFTRDPIIVTRHYYPKASYSRGDYIGEVTSESEGAYPANGRYTDGYWYVRQ